MQCFVQMQLPPAKILNLLFLVERGKDCKLLQYSTRERYRRGDLFTGSSAIYQTTQCIWSYH